MSPSRGWSSSWRALRSRNYRLFFSGQLVSLIGTFLTQMATAWLVYRLARRDFPGHAAIMLGLVGFAAQIPMFCVAPFAGVLVDRWNKHRLLIATQALAMVQSLALAALTFTFINIPLLVALSLFQGLVNSFDMPSRQAFLIEMIEDRADLPNAIALNSTMVQLARLIGPAAAGLLVQAIGEGFCFLIDGLSYIAVIAALLAMRVVPKAAGNARAGEERRLLADLKEGVEYVGGFKPMRVLLIMLALISLSGMPAFSVLMPFFGDALGPPGRGAQTMGFLVGCSGIGALVGALYLTRRPTVVGLGKVLAAAAAIFGVSLITFALSQWLWLSLALAVLVGLGMITVFASANTIMQTLAEDEKRGRVMSFFTMAFLGMTPFGNILSGTLATHLGTGIHGARITVVLAGIVCVVCAAVFAMRLPALRRIVRPIYVQRGILPELAAGVQAAAEITRRES